MIALTTSTARTSASFVVSWALAIIAFAVASSTFASAGFFAPVGACPASGSFWPASGAVPASGSGFLCLNTVPSCDALSCWATCASSCARRRPPPQAQAPSGPRSPVGLRDSRGRLEGARPAPPVTLSALRAAIMAPPAYTALDVPVIPDSRPSTWLSRLEPELQLRYAGPEKASFALGCRGPLARRQAGGRLLEDHLAADQGPRGAHLADQLLHDRVALKPRIREVVVYDDRLLLGVVVVDALPGLQRVIACQVSAACQHARDLVKCRVRDVAGALGLVLPYMGKLVDQDAPGHRVTGRHTDRVTEGRRRAEQGRIHHPDAAQGYAAFEQD